jgi:cyclopropane fatty-acyl-phospholipid synthase-like methyltransferase
MAGRVCPWWIGYFLASPIRKLYENPDKILNDYIRPGMTVLDVGCAMGFFSLYAAKKVGRDGKVIAIDLQPKMIDSLKKRIRRAGLDDRIDARVCGENSLEIGDLTGRVDLALAIHVVHEVPDVPRLMTEVFDSLKTGSKFYIIEPKGHASTEEFAATEESAQKAGFTIIDHPEIKRDRTTLLLKE